jgi:Thioredoxin-like
MRVLLVIFLLVASVCRAICGPMPLTAKEIGLMLRSGYSSEAVMRELSARHFADSFDSTVEKQLVQSGADKSLIDALRSGAYRLSPSEIAAAKEKLAEEEHRGVLAAEQSRESGPPQDSAPAPARPAGPPAVGVPGATYQLLKGDLVYWHQGTLSHFDDEALENKKLYLFFFSANWSPQGRKFTPQLVEYYNRVAPQHPEFEVIFFSADRSPFGMETYMGQANMPWPAVDYEKLGSKAAIQNNFVRGLPCLVLVDGSGKVLSNSYGTEKNLGPETVLADLDKILNGKSESAVAQRP